jgi:hypothetical protein
MPTTAEGADRRTAAREAARAIRERSANVLDREVERLMVQLAETIDGRPTDHVIEFGDHGWTLQHPLIGCGLDLFRCPVNAACDRGVPKPQALGRYRVELVDGALVVDWCCPLPTAT